MDPDPRDGLLLDELCRSVEVMPLDLDIIKRLVSSLNEFSDGVRMEQAKPKVKMWVS